MSPIKEQPEKNRTTAVHNSDAHAQVVEAMSERDAKMAAEQPKPSVPEDWEGHVFQTPELPQAEPFSLRNLATFDETQPFRAEDFVTDPETGITTAHTTDGEPFVLRIRRQWTQPGTDTCAMESVKDDGTFEVWVITPLNDNTLEITEPEFS